MVLVSPTLSYIYYIAPGPVSELSYEEDTSTSVKITWKPPKELNGDIVAYFVEHGVYQNESTTGVELLARGEPMYNTVIRALGRLLPTFISKLRLEMIRKVVNTIVLLAMAPT